MSSTTRHWNGRFVTEELPAIPPPGGQAPWPPASRRNQLSIKHLQASHPPGGQVFGGEGGRQTKVSAQREMPDDQMVIGHFCYQTSRSHYSNSATGSRSSRMYIGRPLLFGKVMDGSMPRER